MVGYDTKNGSLFAGDVNFATEPTPLDFRHCVLRCNLQPLWSCTSNTNAQHCKKLLAQACRDPNPRSLRIAYPSDLRSAPHSCRRFQRLSKLAAFRNDPTFALTTTRNKHCSS
ncbi:uncharacterized protein BKA55DRAFT_338428 [Fusarium redolens]|uniref:Uncharacterized protein n=1 Tax=Fusarium redolens TaxID=48865 RepID=A0A9P9HFF2_FUSRE|nr:uncharacterized protein BKA55DRAFT_338428 [Fusarium redolens]KAH7255953.1 hypothetical protein BKA55DRAFT_338428 [Fusarium redolens]